MNNRKYSQIIILLWAWSLREIRAGKSLHVQSHKCEYNGKYIESFNISVVENRISCELKSKVRIPAGVIIHMDIERRANHLGPYNSFFQYDVDYCKTIGTYRSTLFKKWLISLVKNGRFPRRCPWPVGVYYLTDWQLSDDLVPPFVAQGHYRSKITTHLGRFGKQTYEMLVECVVISELI